MKRLPLLALACGLLVAACALISAVYAYNLHKARAELELLLGTELVPALEGLLRVVRLAVASAGLPSYGAVGPPATAAPALLAAYEQSLIIRRLAPVAEQLLAQRGVRAEPLAGYLFSLAGGVASLCAEARRTGRVDGEWLAEIRRRIGEVHGIINRPAVELLTRQELQRAVDRLFGADPAAVYFSSAAAETSACPYS